jgi:hypothetical protein
MLTAYETNDPSNGDKYILVLENDSRRVKNGSLHIHEAMTMTEVWGLRLSEDNVVSHAVRQSGRRGVWLLHLWMQETLGKNELRWDSCALMIHGNHSNNGA